MQPLAIAKARLNGMPEGMAEIKDGAQALLPFILTDDPGLDFTTAPDGMRQRHGVARKQGIHIGFNPVKEIKVGDGPVLDNLGQTCTQFAGGQGVQHVQVTHDQLWLVKRANHVLAKRMVDGRLAAYRGIDLGQQGRGYLHKRHTAHVTRRSKTGHVTNHATAQRKQDSFPVTAVFQQRVKNQLQGLPVLIDLAIRKHSQQHLFVVPAERRLELPGIKGGDGGIADNQRRCRRRKLSVSGRFTQKFRTNNNRVTALCEVDLNFGACWRDICGHRFQV